MAMTSAAVLYDRITDSGVFVKRSEVGVRFTFARTFALLNFHSCVIVILLSDVSTLCLRALAKSCVLLLL